MATFFPRQTIEFHIEEPAAFRRFSFSMWEMAAVTGVVIRLFRLVVLTHGSNSWLYFGGTVTLGILVLLGMVTAHLANYPLHRWWWRALGFAAIEVAAEMLVSLVLIYAGHEPIGTVRAHYADLPVLLRGAVLVRGGPILLWSLFLAGIVTLVRRSHLVKEEVVMDSMEEAD